MKKTLKWAFLAFIVLCAFFSFTQVRENTISGTMENLSAGDRVYVVSYHASKKAWIADDSITVKKDGEFAIETTDKNEVVRVYFVPAADTLDVKSEYSEIFLEGLGKYSIEGDAAVPAQVKINGGVYQYPQMQSLASLQEKQKELMASIVKLRSEQDAEAALPLQEEYKNITAQQEALHKEIILTYPQDIHSSYVLKEEYRLTPQNISMVDSLYSALGEKAVKSKYAREVKKNMDNLSRALEGAEAPDFALTDLAGNTVRLSEMKGKVVLVEFWASWCGPCRRSNPHLVQLYDKYHPHGLEVLGIAVKDKDEDWRKAIEEDGLKWTQLNSGEVVKGQANVAETYVVSYIPTSILVDAQGKIVFRGSPNDIDAALAKVFPDVK